MGGYLLEYGVGQELTDSRLSLKSRPPVCVAEVVLVSPLASNGYALHHTIEGSCH